MNGRERERAGMDWIKKIGRKQHNSSSIETTKYRHGFVLCTGSAFKLNLLYESCSYTISDCARLAYQIGAAVVHYAALSVFALHFHSFLFFLSHSHRKAIKSTRSFYFSFFLFLSVFQITLIMCVDASDFCLSNIYTNAHVFYFTYTQFI